MTKAIRIVVAAMLMLLGAGVQAFDHSAWDGLLKAHVQPLRGGLSTAVDYAGMAQDRESLQAYLTALAAVETSAFDGWEKSERLAFLINAYNAWTVEFILTRWPDIDTIKDLGSLFRSPWKKAFIPLFGDTVSLDGIEHGMIRADGAFEDPRIHFAVNCASVGCPSLRAEAYTGERLDQQLEEQTQTFLSDRTRNREQGDELALSSIFKWYRVDFERGWAGYMRLEDFLLQWGDALELSPAMRGALKKGDAELEFLNYDWSLNRIRTAP